ncbi:tetratricopeptide repeat protein [Methanolobus sp.]|uniref:tetratricopeptide repeat protein n=1 Tax=Methanolobus sp. TaxID=1874737 RepID=UPI0025EBBEAA|nr:tetratricopeptide repeat protein [Methanolobus sp.]
MGMLDDVKAKKKQKSADNWMKMAESAKTIEKQIEYYTKSLDIDPYNAEAWIKKGKSLEKLGRFEEAKKCFDIAVEIEPAYNDLTETKYESNAAHAVSPASSVVEDTTFISESDVPLVAEEQDTGDQWFTKTPAAVTAADDVISQKDEYSFASHVGDESAFSNVLIDDDNGSPASFKENDDEVFGNSYEGPSVIPEPEIISGDGRMDENKDDEASIFAAISNGVEKEHDEREGTFSSIPVHTPEEESFSFISDKNVISENTETINYAPVNAPANAPVIPEEEKSSVGYVAEAPTAAAVVKRDAISSEAITRPAVIKTSGVEPVDIRIPLSEAIKFWAIGIVAMLIVMILSSMI